MAEKIRVLLVEPMGDPRLVEIDHTLEAMQEQVGGYIQVLYPWDDPVGLVTDDEGKFKGYLPNRALEDEEGNVYDIICGNFFICGLGKREFASISDEMAEKFSHRFRFHEMFMRTMDEHLLMFRLGSGEAPRVIG